MLNQNGDCYNTIITIWCFHHYKDIYPILILICTEGNCNSKCYLTFYTCTYRIKFSISFAIQFIKMLYFYIRHDNFFIITQVSLNADR